MKMRTFLICVLILFGLVLLLGRVSIGSSWFQRVDVSYALTLTLCTVGGVIAMVSLFSLLQRALAGQALEQSLPFMVTLLGGLLLYQLNWGVALAFGMLGTTLVVMHHWGRPNGPGKG